MHTHICTRASQKVTANQGTQTLKNTWQELFTRCRIFSYIFKWLCSFLHFICLNITLHTVCGLHNQARPSNVYHVSTIDNSAGSRKADTLATSEPSRQEGPLNHREPLNTRRSRPGTEPLVTTTLTWSTRTTVKYSSHYPRSSPIFSTQAATRLLSTQAATRILSCVLNHHSETIFTFIHSFSF